MVKFSKKVEYGLVAILHLDFINAYEQVTTKDISTLYGIPEEHLGKVLQRMAKSGLLHSVKGAKGGYALARPLSEITLGELVETLDGPVKVAHEGEDHAVCKQFCTCYVRGAVHEAQVYLRDYMRTVTLDRILKSSEQHAGSAA
jgi:Rrf2 family protein